jgi:CHAT domain-containing protein
VSLFKVPDVETRELMKGFYRQLGRGLTPGEALHGAKLELIARRRGQTGAAHPFFWASFVPVGESR